MRFAQLDELLQICKLMWTEDEPSFAGEHYSIDGASGSPTARGSAANLYWRVGEKVGLPLAGRHADIWNGSARGTEDDWRRKVDIVHGAAADAGRDPAAIEVCQTVEKALPETDAEASELVELLGHKMDLGVSYFVMDFGNPLTTDHVSRFAEQVMAPLKAR